MSEIDRLRARFEPAATVPLTVLDVPLVVHTDHPQVAGALARYFAPYVAPSAAPDAAPVYVSQGAPEYDLARLREVARGEAGKGIKEAAYDTAAGRIVVKRRTGVAIYVAEPEHFVVGDVLTHFNQVVNAVTTVFTKRMLRRGYAMIHASAALGPPAASRSPRPPAAGSRPWRWRSSSAAAGWSRTTGC